MEIKKAKIKNLDEITNLSSASAMFHEKLTPYYILNKDFKTILKKSLKKNIYSSNSLILVAEENNEIVGYLLAFKINRPEMFSIKKTGLISDIFIKENYRKRGIGELLAKESFNWFKKSKIKTIEINIESKNKPALNFWNALDFEDVSIEKYKKLN
ncbi:MAG: GNAT family N-acetyltransferase [Candidatus Paceibacterota bacterium]|jgi:ribosomal protein S18 acetylase RimI-like enzyme